MLKLNIEALFSALSEAESFVMPDMTAGTAYLYDSVYKRLAKEEDVYLKELDFERFSLDDVVSLQLLYNETIEGNAVDSRRISDALAKEAPVSAAVGFV